MIEAPKMARKELDMDMSLFVTSERDEVCIFVKPSSYAIGRLTKEKFMQLFEFVKKEKPEWLENA